MKRGIERGAPTPEEATFTRDCFELGRQVALRGIPAGPREHWGNEDKTTFIGEHQGKKYGVRYSVLHNEDGRDFHTVTLMGRNLHILFRTETSGNNLINQKYTTENNFNIGNLDPKSILAEITAPTEQPVTPEGKEKELGTAFRLDDNEGPGHLLIVAEDEKSAAEKYLDWCEANNNFDEIFAFRKHPHYFTRCNVLS